MYFYLEISVNTFILNLVWNRCLEVSVGATPGGKKASEDAVNPSVRAGSPRSRGGSDLSPGGRLSTPPTGRVGHRRQFFRRGHRGLTCGAGVTRSWCRGVSNGAT